MSNRVHGIMLLVGAGLALPKTRPLTSRRAQQAAPLRSKSHNDRHSRDPHHSLKSLYFVRQPCVRICSLLPSATEIVYALGLGDQRRGAAGYLLPGVGRSPLCRGPLDSGDGGDGGGDWWAGG